MRLLVIEDEQKIARALKKALVGQGYAVDIAFDGDDGYAMATTEPYDAMIIDRMLPGQYNGTEIVQAMRQADIATPVLLLTALGTTRDKTTGLDIGADDYLVKPFDLDELFARIRALLRRPAEVQTDIITIDDLTINRTDRSASRQSTTLNLTKTEFALLEYLASISPRPASKNTLIDHVWDFDSDILPNTVEVYIRNLRSKIDKPFKRKLLKTVRDVGYKLEGGK